jgi:hypothetical protein
MAAKRARAAALLGLALAACATPTAVPSAPALAPAARVAPIPPDDADRAAAALAAAALAGDRARADAELARLETLDAARVAAHDARSGLVPVARDLRAATLGDRRVERAVTQALLDAGDLDPALEARLEIQEADDPLALADARMRDSRWSAFARAFNAIAEPVGRSLLTAVLAPYRLGYSLFSYGVGLYAREPLAMQERQALAQWQRFLELHPNAPEAAELRAKVDRARVELARTLAARELAAGEQALREERADVAVVHADRALRLLPEDPDALDLEGVASARAESLRRARERSAQASADARAAQLDAAERELLGALLDPSADLAGAAQRAREGEPSKRLRETARYVAAIATAEAGREDQSLDALERAAARDDEGAAIARHARSWLESPELSPYRAYRRERWRNRRQLALFVVAGPWFRGPPDRGLPAPVEWLLDLPALPQVLLGSPIRLLQLPWTDPMPAELAAAIQAKRYLARFPRGEHAGEVAAWLGDFEADRGNAIGALHAARLAPAPDAAELRELEEAAAAQALEVASGERSRALRFRMYRDLLREFPDTASARTAGIAFREELLDATPQRVRISRGFLVENPAVAGPLGLGLSPQLLDGDASNGELHPDGVTLLGGGEIEVAYRAPGRDEKAAPESRREPISSEALARVVSLVDETALRNSLLDSDDAYLADAQRDVFFERARLELGDDPAARVGASASFSYRGMRERYGMVRARESILPFDLVLQGSLWDFSLGAFPRWRAPRETPDAYLYR